MLLEGSESEQLLSGRDTQFAVNIFVVIFQRIFFDPGDLHNLSGTSAVQIQLIDAVLCRSQAVQIGNEEFVLFRNDFLHVLTGQPPESSLCQFILLQRFFVGGFGPLCFFLCRLSGCLQKLNLLVEKGIFRFQEGEEVINFLNSQLVVIFFL